jgi:hypothetical protein
MKRWMYLAVTGIALATLTARAADDPRVSFLEQEVRNLHRQVDALSRQVDDLRTRPDRPRSAGAALARPGSTGPTPAGSTEWVDAALWKKIHPGMTELEVIGTLGPPTTMREEAGARVLLYALEIGTSGFLGGSVVFRDRVVAAVHQPTLQ